MNNMKETNDNAEAGSLDTVIVLRIRSLIADKEMVTAQANLDLAKEGSWRCDYAAWHNQIDCEIQELLNHQNTNQSDRA